MIEVIQIGLGTDIKDNTLLGFLYVLFKYQGTLADKKKLLETRFQMKLTRQMEGALTNMCNLGEGLIADGIELGLAQGLEQGLEQGLQDLIETYQDDMQLSYDEAVAKLQKKRKLDKSEAERIVKKFWN